jgi:hypothetical protein
LRQLKNLSFLDFNFTEMALTKSLFVVFCLFALSCSQKAREIDYTDWSHYGGPEDGSRYSALTANSPQILQSYRTLSVAIQCWRYRVIWLIFRAST